MILSDYGKGGARPGGHRAPRSRGRAALGIPVYVDPKSDDFRRYRGATCITPNLKELALAARLPVASDAEIIAAATKVMREAGADGDPRTRSDKGMVLVEASGAVHVEPARAREVYDVTGAGDTVIAVLALACAGGYALPQAMRLANTAAGIVVCKLGTATVELDELMLELSRDVRDAAWHARQILQRRRGRDAGAAAGRAAASASASPMAASTSSMPAMSRCWRRRGPIATG